MDRTTLEQIADWLTNIIVGVALTQVPVIERRLNRLTLDVTHDLYSPQLGPAGCGRLVGGSIIAAFAIGGFLVAYLLMRRWFILEMLDRDKQITQTEGEIAKAKDEARVQAFPDTVSGQVGAAAGQADPVALGVTPDAQARLAGQTALLYLHPTFGSKVRLAGFGADGRARLQLFAWGSFTVGAILPDGGRLELNLAQLPVVPDGFRNR